jgi:hypothetical protein
MSQQQNQQAKKIVHTISKHQIPSTLLKGAVMSAGAQTGKSLMSKLAKHPLLILGIGIATGYYAHKYRKEIISSVSSASEKGKDFVLQQKENLEDMVAETKESED